MNVTHKTCSDQETAAYLWNAVPTSKINDTSKSLKDVIASTSSLVESVSVKSISDIFIQRHITGRITYSQYLCLIASLSEDSTFKAKVAFDHLTSNKENKLSQENFIQIAKLIIKDEKIIVGIYEKMNSSGAEFINEFNFVDFLPKDTTQDNSFYSVTHQMETIAKVRAKKTPSHNNVKEPKKTNCENDTAGGTSPLQIQIGFFRLIQGAAYRCFRASYTANSETHLRAYDLPYSISNFVTFIDRITNLYISSGVLEEDPINEVKKLRSLVFKEYDELKSRIQKWSEIKKDPHMLQAEALLENEELEIIDEHNLFLAIIEVVLSIGIDGENHYTIDHSDMALNELNRLRLKEELAELGNLSKSRKTLSSIQEDFIQSWQRVIVDDADAHIPGSIMPVKFWYEKFMPQLLLACSASTNEELNKISALTDKDLDNWHKQRVSNGNFSPYALDVQDHFPGNSLEIKKSIQQAWRLSEHYLNGVQKRREREEFGRNDGYLCEYVAFIDIYLSRNDVELSDMRLSFPYYIGPATWRFMHTMAEISCTNVDDETIVSDFKDFFRSLATVYPCPYCRYHLNRYVVQNKEIKRYPLEYLFLGFNSDKMDLTISLEDKLAVISTPEDLRLFIWKLHNTVSSSIARSEAWFKTEQDPLYTNRYWPSLDTEMERAHAFSEITVELSRIYKVYHLLKPVSKLETLRDELQYALETSNSDLFFSCKERFNETIGLLEKEIISSGFLQETYHYNPALLIVAPHFTAEDEAYARSGGYYEN